MKIRIIKEHNHIPEGTEVEILESDSMGHWFEHGGRVKYVLNSEQGDLWEYIYER